MGLWPVPHTSPFEPEGPPVDVHGMEHSSRAEAAVPQGEIVTEHSIEQIAGAVAGRGGGPDLAGTLQGIAAAALTALSADRATLYVIDVDTQNVVSVYTTETDQKRRAFLERSVGLGPAQMPIWQLSLAQPDPLIAIEDIGSDPAVSAELAARLGSGALLGVRLEHVSVQQAGAAALLGTLFCSYSRPRRFSKADRDAARGLARLATLALANARLQAETAASLGQAEGLASEQAALGRVARLVAAEERPKAVFRQTAEEVAGLLGVELGLVARFESGRAVPVGWRGAPIDVAFPLDGGGALAQVARTGQVARVGDYMTLADDHVGQLVESRGYRSGVAVPVRVGGALWGALLAATTRHVPISAEAEARLERFADLVALAIANAEAQARLIAQAANDPMTGLANHRTFFERLDAEVQRARRHGTALSLVILDLDHFKRVNDQHGHLVGDAVLTAAAARLAGLVRAEDTLGRIGGEEFALLLPDSDAQAAWLAGERARRAIAEISFAKVGPVTISAGVAELRDGIRVTELFRRADAALYWAKDHGRNICMRYAPEQEKALAARPVVGTARLASGAERLVALAHEQLGLTATVLTEFQATRLVIRQVAGDVGAFGMRLGLEIPLGETYCARIAEGGGAQVVRDAKRESHGRGLVVAPRAEVGAYVGVPVMLPNGDLFGTLCCLSRRAEPGLSEADVRMLRIIAGILAEDLDRVGRTDRADRLKHDRLRRLMTGEGFSVVLQPIVELTGGRVVAVEALSRFAAEPHRAPDRWFADAAALGLGVELELLAIRRALTRLDELPPGVRLSVNVSPTTLCTSELRDALAEIAGDRLAIEITEHAAVDDYAALRVALTGLRSRGVQLMVDDAGAGFSSFKHILDLQPDVIKLDLSLTRDIDTDPLRRALAASVLAFAEEIGARIIAEGIETAGELAALRSLGVTHGQGYLLARPGPGPVPSRVSVAGPTALMRVT